jgi:hypothetical protein
MRVEQANEWGTCLISLRCLLETTGQEIHLRKPERLPDNARRFILGAPVSKALYSLGFDQILWLNIQMAIKPGSKYYPLYEYLRQSGKDRLMLGLEDIERIIHDSLPTSARKDRAFWSNRGSGALQAAAWVQSGYHVVGIDLRSERIVFEKPVLRYTVRREGDTILWNADMIRALRDHLGVNQADMAALLGVRQQTVSEWETSAYSPTRARSKHLSMVAEQAEFSFEEGFHEAYSSPKSVLDKTSETV